MTKQRHPLLTKLLDYKKTYGEVKDWSLALKFQVLFEAIQLVYKYGNVTFMLVEDINQIVWDLANLENSGIVRIKSDLRDKHWEESSETVYTCGRYVLKIAKSNSYKRWGIDTDWWFSVEYNNPN